MDWQVPELRPRFRSVSRPIERGDLVKRFFVVGPCRFSGRSRCIRRRYTPRLFEVTIVNVIGAAVVLVKKFIHRMKRSFVGT